MNLADMTTLAYALGIGLIAVAVIGIAQNLKSPKNGRTYGASISEGPNYGA